MIRWFNRRPTSSSSAQRPATARLRVEPLEDRLTPATASLETWTDRFDQEDQQLNDGRGLSDSKDSSKLGWSESYILSSYLSMYEATGDLKYLQKFVEHSDRVLDNASDPDGDGFLGWGTYKYATSLARNPGFEFVNPADPTMAIGWTRWQSSPFTAYRDLRNDRGGVAGMTIRTNPARGWQVVQSELYNSFVRDNKRYEPDTLYQLSFNGKTNGSKAGGRAEVYDFTTNERLAMVRFHNTSWKAHSITFRTPAEGGHRLVVRLMHVNYKVAGGTVSFDLVRVRQLSEYAVHDGMIAAPMAEFAALVRRDSRLTNDYDVTADRYAAFIRDEILPKWEQYFRPIGSTGGTYVFPDDGSTGIPRQSLPHNQSLALGNVMVWLSMAEPEGDEALEERATKLATTFKRHLLPVGGGYLWRYSDRLLSGDYGRVLVAEDVSHANISVGFAITAASAGIVFKESDLQRFSKTLTAFMWNRSMSTPRVSTLVNGTGGYSRSWYLSGWADLAQFDPSKRTHRLVDAVYNFRGKWEDSGPSGLLTIARLAEAAKAVEDEKELAATPAGR